MKNVIFLFIICGSFYCRAISQTLSQEERQKIVDSLQGARYSSRLTAIARVKEYNIIEALPFLEQRIWQQSNITLKLKYLEALQQFSSSSFPTYAQLIIDSAGVFSQNSIFDSLQIKVSVTSLLFKVGDYTTTQYVFDLLYKDTTESDYEAVELLKQIFLNVPAYSTSAKSELRRIAKSNHGSSMIAFRNYVALFGEEATEDMVEIFMNHQKYDLRWFAMGNLCRLNYSGLHELFLEKLNNEPDAGIRFFIAESLLIRYGTILDYHLVANHSKIEADSLVKSLLDFEIQRFQPPQPERGTPIQTMIDSLISLKHQVAAYGWLGNQDFIDELDVSLDRAKIYIQQGDSLNCRRLIKIFQQNVDEEYNDSLDGNTREVRMGGWQFLYWNAEYILKRLPDVPSLYRKEE
jgi:hypothetical protein